MRALTIMVATLTFLGILLPGSRGYADCALSADGLVGHWELNETSGSAIADSSSTANNGAWSDGAGDSVAEETVSGIVGTALHFSGVKVVTIPNNAAYDTDGTWTAWVKTTDSGGGSDVILSRHDAAQCFNGISLVMTSTGKVRAQLKNGSATSCQFQGTKAVNDGAWHHIALVYTRANGGQSYIYVDGALDATCAANSAAWNFNSQATRIGNSLCTFWSPFLGDIDDARIYNRALSADEIATLYSTRSTADAPAGYMIYDTRHARMMYCNGTNWVHAGTGSYNPNAVNFDGTNDRLSTSSPVGYADSDKFSASFWIRIDTGATNLKQIFNIFNGTNDRFYIGMSYGPLHTFLFTANNAAIAAESNQIVTEGEWHHVLISYNNGTPRIYIDDVDQLSWQLGSGVIDFDTTSATVGFGAHSGGSNKVPGSIADFWLDMGTYIDFSVAANRAKFRSGSGMPMYLGPDGSLPTGSKPDIFLSGDTANWHTNKGAGGGFTENGAIAFSSSQPGDAAIAALSKQDAYCWGSDGSGQLGISAADDSNTQPTSVPAGGHNWVQISASDVNTCAVDEQGDAYCWGLGTSGEIGDGSWTTRQTPSMVAGGHKWAKVSVGWTASCGIATDGKAYCWGLDDSDQAGNNDSNVDDSNPPTLVYETGLTGTGWIDIAAGDEHACGVRNSGDAYCWGADTNGALGNGATTGNQDIPQLVLGSPTGSKWTDIDANFDYTCGVRDNGAAYCWGADASGQLGNGGTTGDQNVPSAVAGGHTFASISTGAGAHACGVTTAGDGYCWGADTNGALGNGAAGAQTSPYLVTGGYVWAQIEAGQNFSCGTTTAGNGYCWGAGAGGQMGNGTTTASNQNPVPVNGGYTWDYITAGKTFDGTHACGITASGCTNPSGEKGVMIYNPDFNVMQYCNGAEWVAMGTVGGTPPTSGLVGHWKLDETSGTTAADSSGSGLTGTLQGSMDAAADTVGGKLATALDFDGTNDRISLGTSNTLNLYDDFTISAWINPRDMGESDGGFGYNLGAILSRFSTAGFIFQTTANGGKKLNLYSESTSSSVTSTGTLMASAWQHVAVTKTAADAVTFYIDGVPAGIGTLDIGSASGITGYIGTWDAGAQSTFDGAVDDLRVYNRALSATEVSQLYYYGLSNGLGDVSGNCANPSKPEGSMFYNIDYSYMQYCNGEQWVGIGK